MGASAWEYFAPYQPDSEKAFHELRQHVFDAGDYYKEQLRQTYREDKKRFSKPKPDTMEELFEMCGESGTHSILDIGHLTNDPESNEYFTAIPLSEVQLLTLFGTTKPTHSMIEEKQHTIWGLRRSWQATYIIVYESEKPVEIYFAGFSGD
ncbi:MAG: hypothetical protein JXB07_14100 [Anaerolineae bacterium]|nr:hypothetical protein [Anaerolineae bacterium]